MIRGVSLGEDVTELVVSALREHAETRAIASPSALGADTPLFGRDGVLDSLGLVALVVAVEQAIEDAYGVSVTLADERALSERKSPFGTVGTLAAYAARLIEGAR
jgi:acyl carrier protein